MALVAPVLLLLAVAAWDGGSVLREQVILEQAARDGARVASAFGEGGISGSANVAAAVQSSAADLPGLSSTTDYLDVSYTPANNAVEVRLRYDHALYTPVLRQLWGNGSGIVRLEASAVFFVPQQTPVPATVVPSTPIPTVTPTPNVTPTVMPTATPTPTVRFCWLRISIPALGNNTGYYVVFLTDTTTWIGAAWWANNRNGNDQLDIYAGNPFAGRPNPDNRNPPAGALAETNGNDEYLDVLTSDPVSPGTYSVYFFNRGGSEPASLAALYFWSSVCP